MFDSPLSHKTYCTRVLVVPLGASRILVALLKQFSTHLALASANFFTVLFVACLTEYQATVETGCLQQRFHRAVHGTTGNKVS